MISSKGKTDVFILAYTEKSYIHRKRKEKTTNKKQQQQQISASASEITIRMLMMLKPSMMISAFLLGAGRGDVWPTTNYEGVQRVINVKYDMYVLGKLTSEEVVNLK